MVKLTIIVILVALGRSGIIARIGSGNVGGLQTASPEMARQHCAGSQARLERAQWIINAKENARKQGLDPESATFRLLQPAIDFGANYNLKSDPHSSLRYYFHDVARAYSDVSYVNVGGYEWGGKRAPVSLQTLFPNTYLSRARAKLVEATGTYFVEIEFGQRGFDSLAAMLGATDHTGPFVDWYPAGHLCGEPITEMRAVVTFENRALVPFSVNEVVNRIMVDQPIVIAKNLEKAAADKLVRCLGF